MPLGMLGDFLVPRCTPHCTFWDVLDPVKRLEVRRRKFCLRRDSDGAARPFPLAVAVRPSMLPSKQHDGDSSLAFISRF